MCMRLIPKCNSTTTTSSAWRSGAACGGSRRRWNCCCGQMLIWRRERSRSVIWRAESTAMDPRLVRHYNQELAHLREVGAEFAEQFPKIAGRLSMSGIEVTDPYVERLLEGVAFLAARVQLKLNAEFPRFTQRLLEIVY